MALIKCPECGKDVSNSASMCPHCGFDIQESFIKNKIKNIKKKYECVIFNKKVNLMEIYIDNNQDCVKAAKQLSGLTHLNLNEAKNIMFDFYDEHIEGRSGVIDDYLYDVYGGKQDNSKGVVCPKCNSNNLHPLSDVNGKGVKSSKLCCLTFLCGNIGTICGLNNVGKTTTTHYWVCKDCGHRFLM
jgi:DNA-directed RNA polymerase subunit RPC12/RpoP